MAQGAERDFISDYLRALSRPNVIEENDENNENKGDLIMAISEHERKLLTAFWEKHRQLIQAAAYATSNDPNQDEEARDEAGKVLQSFSSKDFSQYTVLFYGKVVARDVKKTAIGREVARVLIESGIREEDFLILKMDKSSGFQLLKQEAEITETEQKYRKYRVSQVEPLTFPEGKDEVQYYASGNWGENNIPKFQKFLKKNFPQVQLKRQDAESGGTDKDL